MSTNKISISDIGSFLRVNLRMYLGAFVVSILIIGGLIFYSNSTTKDSSEKESLDNVISSFIIENKQGNIMNNSGAIKQVLTSSLSDETELFSGVIEKVNVSYDNIKNSINISLHGNLSSGNKEEIKNFITKKLENKDLEFFKDKKLYFLSIEDKKISTGQDTGAVSKKKIIAYFLVGIILTFCIGTAFSSMKESKNKKITQKFNLGNDVSTIDFNSLKFNSNENLIDAINAILNGNQKNKLLLLPSNKQVPISSFNSNVYQDLERIKTQLLFNPDEIIIVCFKNETSKRWYREQLEIAKALTTIIKVIYI